ncbi:acetylgalactosaminyl-O-glycosyl-glycoprotein beta-1,3-N-acetylglucosaminyltransferase-like [Elgaria multicarinata webbii]|uniref:acetylgalactosaminyl-O-glycosyl-glycoprotein beta-1,3-N-acetylglucosaminyltransferase-like n=1 Tax=Elgaria multicarinata webbii TaxID=159646 RepID=UPI002FCCC6FF
MASHGLSRRPVAARLSHLLTQRPPQCRIAATFLVLGSVLLLLCAAFSRRWPFYPKRQSATLTDGIFTFHLDLDVYKSLFPHLQHHQCQEVISEDALCRGHSRTRLLLLAINSHPASSDRRAALRRTWARPREVGGFTLRPVFLMATTANVKHARLVRLESAVFGDVLMWGFVESLHNRSLKQRCLLQWLQGRCRHAAYVFKGDDNLFVNLKALTGYLSILPRVPRFIHGNVRFHAAVVREGEYGVSRTLYPMQCYPDFASGGALVVPGPSIPALYRASLRLPVFPLDDVDLGFLALAARLPHQHNGRFRVWRPGEDELAVYQEALSVHGASAERVEHVWWQLWGLSGGTA